MCLEGLRHWGLQDKLDSLETRRIEIEVQLTAAPAPGPRIHPNLAELYRRKVEALREALDDPDIRDKGFVRVNGIRSAVLIGQDLHAAS